jgi:hypothetical protein
MSTKTGVSYEVTPLSSVLSAYGRYHFGIYITFVCWNLCAVSDNYGFFFGRRYGCGYVWIFTRITIGVWAYPRVLRGGWRCGIYTLRGWCHRISATNGGRMRGAWRYNDVFV